MSIKSLFNDAFEAGRNVQIKEHANEDIDGKLVWNLLEAKTGPLKNKILTDNSEENIKYNSNLENIYCEMDKIIVKYKMNESEFLPISNHFFCQLKNLVKSKSNFNIQLNRVMQLGFNAGQLSVFIENKTLLEDRYNEISNFIKKYKMLELDTYVDIIKQSIINKLHLVQVGGNSKRYFIYYS